MRFRESDYATIKKKAEKVNMNFTKFVTTAAMNKPITVINGLTDVLKEQKAMRFDIVISFDAKDRREVYANVIADVRKAFPDYELQVAMDTDFTEE